MDIFGCKNEIIGFIMNASDVDSLIIASFIAGMQAKKSVNGAALPVTSNKGKRVSKPSKTTKHNNA